MALLGSPLLRVHRVGFQALEFLRLHSAYILCCSKHSEFWQNKKTRPKSRLWKANHHSGGKQTYLKRY